MLHTRHIKLRIHLPVVQQVHQHVDAALFDIDHYLYDGAGRRADSAAQDRKDRRLRLTTIRP